MGKVGGCACGNVRFEVEGDPAMKALCHCVDCRKTSGSAFSTNAVYPESSFKITQGTTKPFTTKGGTGNDITSHFCGDCGTTIWRDGPSFPGLKVVKAGTLDDVSELTDLKPAAELFAPQRVSWVPATEGAVQRTTMSD